MLWGALPGLALRAPYGVGNWFPALFTEEESEAQRVKAQAVKLVSAGQGLDGHRLQGRGTPDGQRGEIACMA